MVHVWSYRRFGQEWATIEAHEVLTEIWVPGAICPVAGKVNKARDEQIRGQQGGRLSQRMSQVHGRMAQAYQDKPAGKISEEFWMRKSGEQQAEEYQI